MKVYFIGAGPGDPELITVKAKKVIEQADVLIYAGSLVNPAILDYARQGAEIYNSASMNLDEIVAVMIEAVKEGKSVARIHTGDPSLYGAIQEQMDRLKEKGVSFSIIPGVSSFTAAAAALQREYTLPGVSQTVIITRVEGRTAVPEGQKIKDLAGHKASLCIFLSVHLIDKVVEELMTGYDAHTPVAVVEKASWPEERIFRGKLEQLASLVEEAGVKKTALILVGDFLDSGYSVSKLYDKNFSHGFRQA